MKVAAAFAVDPHGPRESRPFVFGISATDDLQSLISPLLASFSLLHSHRSFFARLPPLPPPRPP